MRRWQAPGRTPGNVLVQMKPLERRLSRISMLRVIDLSECSGVSTQRKRTLNHATSLAAWRTL
jgi:hypothetical protein